MQNKARHNFIMRLGLVAAMGAVLALWVGMEWPCVIRALLGVPCATCGMSRAWLAALRLDLAEAFAMHPMFWSVPVLFSLYIFGGAKPPRWTTPVYLGLVLGFFVCYIIRLAAFMGGAEPV